MGSFRWSKYANFLGVPVHKSQIRKFLWLLHESQIRKFLQNAAQLCLKIVLKVVFLNDFYVMYFELAIYMT